MSATSMEHRPFPTGLYPILDPDVVPNPLIERRVQKLCVAGVGVIQVRVKTGGPERLELWARRIVQLCGDFETRVVVNDEPKIALSAHAHGVHLGQEDCSVEEARSILGSRAWIGLSTHNLFEVEEANGRTGSSRPDYIGFGPLFHTRNRAMAHAAHGFEGLIEAVAQSNLPVIAIGGIGAEHLHDLSDTGAHGFATIASVCAPSDQFDAFLGACSTGPERFRVSSQ